MTMIYWNRFVIIGLFWSVIGPAQGSARASTPAEQIKETIEHVLLVLNDSHDGAAMRQRDSLRTILLPRFDFREMAKRSLGAHWRSEPAKQDEFVAVFTDFVENAYVGKIMDLKEDKIVFVGESVDKELAQVQTKIIPTKGEPFELNYKLHWVDGSWKVYDVVIADISLVSNYRSQFHRIITNGSFDELLTRLKAKASQNGH